MPMIRQLWLADGSRLVGCGINVGMASAVPSGGVRRHASPLDYLVAARVADSRRRSLPRCRHTFGPRTAPQRSQATPPGSPAAGSWYWIRLWSDNSPSSSIRIRLCGNTSTTATVRNSRCSSKLTSRRLVSERSSAATRSVVAVSTTERRSVSLARWTAHRARRH